MSATSWVCAQVRSKAEHLGRDLGEATSEEETAFATNNTDLGFWCLSFVWRLSGRALEREIGMGLSGSCRDEPEVPA